MKHLLPLLALLPLSALADIYKCTDENGQTSYQHYKCEGETETIHRKSGYEILFDNTGLVEKMQPMLFATANALLSRRTDPYTASRALDRARQNLAPDFRSGGHFYKKIKGFYSRHFTEDEAERLLPVFESQRHQALLQDEKNLTRRYWQAMNGVAPVQTEAPEKTPSSDNPALQKWQKVMSDHRAEYDNLFTGYIDDRIMPEVDKLIDGQ